MPHVRLPEPGDQALVLVLALLRGDRRSRPGGLPMKLRRWLARLLLTAEEWWQVEQALTVVANDPREPERYREWYQQTLDRVRRLGAAE